MEYAVVLGGTLQDNSFPTSYVSAAVLWSTDAATRTTSTIFTLPAIFYLSLWGMLSSVPYFLIRIYIHRGGTHSSWKSYLNVFWSMEEAASKIMACWVVVAFHGGSRVTSEAAYQVDKTAPPWPHPTLQISSFRRFRVRTSQVKFWPPNSYLT